MTFIQSLNNWLHLERRYKFDKMAWGVVDYSSKNAPKQGRLPFEIHLVDDELYRLTAHTGWGKVQITGNRAIAVKAYITLSKDKGKNKHIRIFTKPKPIFIVLMLVLTIAFPFVLGQQEWWILAGSSLLIPLAFLWFRFMHRMQTKRLFRRAARFYGLEEMK